MFKRRKSVNDIMDTWVVLSILNSTRYTARVYHTPSTRHQVSPDERHMTTNYTAPENVRCRPCEPRMSSNENHRLYLGNQYSMTVGESPIGFVWHPRGHLKFLRWGTRFNRLSVRGNKCGLRISFAFIISSRFTEVPL